MAKSTEAAGAEEPAAGAEPGGRSDAKVSADTESVFLPDGESRFTPTEHARGPWDPRALHGGAPATLIAGAFERIEPETKLPFARLSFSFLRPIPMAPLSLGTRVLRPGRRVQELEADLYAGEELVCRAHALRILPAPEELPALAQQVVAESEPPRLPGPEQAHAVQFAPDEVKVKSFAASAMEMRFLHGRPLKGQLPDVGVSSTNAPVGAAGVWMRLCRPVLPGETPSPLVYTMAAADFGNGIAAILPFDEYVFINADLSVTLNRRPEGEWIGLDARTLLHPGGIAWAQSTLHDKRGPFGLATQALVVQPR
jgi:acyl-coenzyme A thioesterase PaaI-like protein